jgi:hypothetical protein
VVLCGVVSLELCCCTKILFAQHIYKCHSIVPVLENQVHLYRSWAVVP